MFFFGDWMLVQWEGSALAPDEQGKAHIQKTFTRVLYNQKTGERRDVFPIQDSNAITDSMFFFDGEKIYHALYQKSITDPETGEPLYTVGVDDMWCRIHFGTGEKELFEGVTIEE